jgi:hypothetical protein
MSQAPLQSSEVPDTHVTLTDSQTARALSASFAPVDSSQQSHTLKISVAAAAAYLLACTTATDAALAAAVVCGASASRVCRSNSVHGAVPLHSPLTAFASYSAAAAAATEFSLPWWNRLRRYVSPQRLASRAAALRRIRRRSKQSRARSDRQPTDADAPNSRCTLAATGHSLSLPHAPSARGVRQTGRRPRVHSCILII